MCANVRLGQLLAPARHNTCQHHAAAASGVPPEPETDAPTPPWCTRASDGVDDVITRSVDADDDCAIIDDAPCRVDEDSDDAFHVVAGRAPELTRAVGAGIGICHRKKVGRQAVIGASAHRQRRGVVVAMCARARPRATNYSLFESLFERDRASQCEPASARDCLWVGGVRMTTS